MNTENCFILLIKENTRFTGTPLGGIEHLLCLKSTDEQKVYKKGILSAKTHCTVLTIVASESNEQSHTHVDLIKTLANTNNLSYSLSLLRKCAESLFDVI